MACGEEVAMGWQPGDDGWRPRSGWLGVLGIAVVALALAGCSKEAKGQATGSAGLPVYKASVQKFKYSGMPGSIKSGESIITLTNRESGEITHEFVVLALPPGTYALACFEDGKIGGGKGKVHATIGMVHQFTVT